MVSDPKIWGLEAGDAGTWAGALMSALAVVVALGIALLAEWSKARDTKANATFAASLLYTDATELLRCLGELYTTSTTLALTKQISFGAPALIDVEAATNALNAIARTISRDHARMLPGHIAADLAMTIGMVVQLSDKIRAIIAGARRVQSISTDFAIYAATNSKIGIDNMRSYFRYCERKFSAESHKALLWP